MRIIIILFALVLTSACSTSLKNQFYKGEKAPIHSGEIYLIQDDNYLLQDHYKAKWRLYSAMGIGAGVGGAAGGLSAGSNGASLTPVFAVLGGLLGIFWGIDLYTTYYDKKVLDKFKKCISKDYLKNIVKTKISDAFQNLDFTISSEKVASFKDKIDNEALSKIKRFIGKGRYSIFVFFGSDIKNYVNSVDPVVSTNGYIIVLDQKKRNVVFETALNSAGAHSKQYSIDNLLANNCKIAKSEFRTTAMFFTSSLCKRLNLSCAPDKELIEKSEWAD